jgi:hypothetical protein
MLAVSKGVRCKIRDTADNPEVILQKQNESAVLRQCLTQLSPAHREIIDLVYYHEKSIAEIAEIIGAPQNTVKTRMFPCPQADRGAARCARFRRRSVSRRSPAALSRGGSHRGLVHPKESAADRGQFVRVEWPKQSPASAGL